MGKIRLKGSTPVTTHTAQTSANFYADSSGVHLDPPTDPSRRLYLYQETYEQEIEASATDDGAVVGALASYYDPSSYAVVYEKMDIPDFDVTRTNPDLATITVSPKSSPFAKNWQKIKILDAVHIQWRSNFVVAQGGFQSLVCAVKPSQDFVVKWTGQPQVDYYVTKAGKYMVSAFVDIIMTCKGAKPLDFDLEWKLQFGNSWTNGWNFIIDTAITAISNSWFDFSMVPLLPVRKQKEYPHRMRNEHSPGPRERFLNRPFPPTPPPFKTHDQFYFIDDYYSDLGSTP